MTLRAIGGLLVLNVGILCAGAGALWGARGWRWWTEFARLVGVAYFLGLGVLTILTMYELVIGVPFGSATMLLGGVGVGVGGVVVGWLRGFAAPGLRRPGAGGFRRSPSSPRCLWRASPYTSRRSFVPIGLRGVAREWDSWANWVPKSESLYLSGHLDLDFLALSPQLASYPPGPTMIQAAAFQAMGSADTVKLHVHVLVLRGRLRRRRDRPPVTARAPGDLVPAAPRIPRRAELPGLGHDGLRRRPDGLLRRSIGAARLPVDRRAEGVAPHRRNRLPVRSNADEARGDPLCGVRAVRGVRGVVRGSASPVAAPPGGRVGRICARPTVDDLVHGPGASGDRVRHGVRRRRLEPRPGVAGPADHARDAIRPRLVALRPVPGDRSDRPGSPGRGTASFAVRRERSWLRGSQS